MNCYICIIHGEQQPPNAAITTVAGTAVCAQHVSHIANHQVLSSRGIEALPTTE